MITFLAGLAFAAIAETSADGSNTVKANAMTEMRAPAAKEGFPLFVLFVLMLGLFSEALAKTS
jgi:hypothetical protein